MIMMAGRVHVLVTKTGDNLANLDGDAGHLVVNVLEAEGLEPKLFGKTQPFVVVELVNQRVQTRPRGINGLEWGASFDL